MRFFLKFKPFFISCSDLKNIRKTTLNNIENRYFYLKNFSFLFRMYIVNPVNKRIKKVRTELNITQRNFSNQICISQSSLGEIETGVRNVNDRIIQLISSQFNINKEWLLTGEGEPSPAQKPVQSDSEAKLYQLLDAYRASDEQKRNAILQAALGSPVTMPSKPTQDINNERGNSDET